MFAILLCWAVMRVWFFFLLFSLASTHWLWKIIPLTIIIDNKSYTYLLTFYIPFFSLLYHVSHLQSDQKRSKSNSRRTHACKKRQCYYWTPPKKVRRSVLFQVYVRRQFCHFVTCMPENLVLWSTELSPPEKRLLIDYLNGFLFSSSNK